MVSTGRTIFRKLLRHQFLLAFVIFAASALASTGIVLSANAQASPDSPGNLASCRPMTDNTKKFTCYAAYYADLTYTQNPKAAFANMEQAYKTDVYVQAQCHQLAHIVGRSGFKKYGNLAAAYPKGSEFCSSGYYHGATEQAITDIGVANIKKKVNDVCAAMFLAKPYSLDHFNCVHGLGHGLMSVEGDDLFKALTDCDNLTNSWERNSCYGGVFMENVMVSIRGDGTSKYLKAGDLLYPCTGVAYQYKEACYLNQSSYALRKYGLDFAKTFALCAQADSDFVSTCNQSIGRDASGTVSSNLAQTIANCSPAPDETAKTNCVIGAVKDIIWFNHGLEPGLQFCASYTDTLQAICQSTARSYYATF